MIISLINALIDMIIRFVPSDDSAAGIKYYVIEKQETFQVPKVIEEEEQGPN